MLDEISGEYAEKINHAVIYSFQTAKTTF
jgi:hypothetical protein